MKYPSKVTTYKESSLPLLPTTLEQLEKKPMTPGELYKKMKNKVGSLNEFMEILDCLYALNKIEFEEGVLRYVG